MSFTGRSIILNRLGLERQGSVAVEFALVFIPFLLLVLFTMELARIVFLYAAIDLSLSEASQRSSNSGLANGASTDYAVLFNNAFKENVQKIPLMFNDDKIDISVKYCDSIAEIIANSCALGSSNKPLAVYSIAYHYRPVFFILSGDYLNGTLVRNIVHVQEYERIAP